jgi:hypothetical protein
VPSRQVLHAVFAEVHGDAIDPGAEPRVAAEGADGLEDLDEHLLCHVFGLVAAAEHAQEQPEHALFVGLHELVEGALVAGNQPLDEALFVRLVELRQGGAHVPTKVVRPAARVAARGRGARPRFLGARKEP